MINHDGISINEAYPSMPVEILGMNATAFAGAEFLVTENEDKAKEISEFKNENSTKNKIMINDKSTIFDKGEEKEELKCYYKIRCSWIKRST